MTLLAIAVVMFVLGYLAGCLGAAVGIWAERQKAKLVVDGLAASNRELMVAVGQLVAASQPASTVSNTTQLDPREQRTFTYILTRGMH